MDLPGGGLEAEQQQIIQTLNEIVFIEEMKYENQLLKGALCQEAQGLGAAGFVCRFGPWGNSGRLSCWGHRLFCFLGL